MSASSARSVESLLEDYRRALLKCSVCGSCLWLWLMPRACATLS